MRLCRYLSYGISLSIDIKREPTTYETGTWYPTRNNFLLFLHLVTLEICLIIIALTAFLSCIPLCLFRPRGGGVICYIALSQQSHGVVKENSDCLFFFCFRWIYNATGVTLSQLLHIDVCEQHSQGKQIHKLHSLPTPKARRQPCSKYQYRIPRWHRGQSLGQCWKPLWGRVWKSWSSTLQTEFDRHTFRLVCLRGAWLP